MSRLLLTGGTGFVGSACARNAVARGHEVHVVARFRREVPAGVVLHRLDLLSESPDPLLRKVRPTHLLHLAWVATPGSYWTSPENERWVTASLTLLAGFAKAGGQRAVLTGTCAEYDWSGAGVLDEQSTPLRPRTRYGRCKDELRGRVEQLATERGISVAWARLFFLYGPGEHPDRLVPYVVRTLLRGEPALCSDGRQRRDYLYVDDAADALLDVLAHATEGPVNIASGHPTALRDLIDGIGRALGRRNLIRFGAKAPTPDDPALLVAAVGRLGAEIGWRPRTGLEDGLSQTVRWWREHGDFNGA